MPLDSIPTASHSTNWPNCWIAPGFDPIKMIQDMASILNSNTGSLDQAHLYLDHMSAAAWCSLANQEEYLSYQRNAPNDYVAQMVSHHLAAGSYDSQSLILIALGSGNGRHEVQMGGTLLRLTAIKNLKMYLVDISQPLLSEAYRYAADHFIDQPGVSVTAIQGNMYHLPRYHQMLHTPKANCKRLVMMLGYTFGNLDNELLFVRNTLNVFQSGDLLLIDVVLAFAPADQPDEVMKKDPRLAKTSPWQATNNKWLTGPIERYRKSTKNISFESFLDNSTCCIPGSYVVEVRAMVDDTAKFTMLRLKRYDANLLIEALEKEGWLAMGGKRYGNGERLMYMFEKK